MRRITHQQILQIGTEFGRPSDEAVGRLVDEMKGGVPDS